MPAFAGFAYDEKAVGEIINLKDNDFNYLFFLISGEMSFTSNVYTDYQLNGGEMLFASRDSKAYGTALSDVKYIILSFDNQFTLCDQLALEALMPFIEPLSIHKLDIRPPLSMVLDSIVHFLHHKIKCRSLHGIKQKEIFLIFRTFYTKPEMAAFLGPILNKDIDFKSFILRHYQEVKTVEELADLCHISVRSFNRKFNEYFNDSPYSWILKQKALHVKNRLADGKTPFIEIIKEFGFSSPAHFTTYCKKHFGCSPTKLRRQLVTEANTPAEKKARD